MTYAQTLSTIKTHCQTAGAGLGNPITDVAIAFPAPKGRCIRIFYGGEADPEVIGAAATLNSVLVGQQTIVMGFWPLSSYSELDAAVIEAEVQAFVTGLRTAIHADFTLGGAVTVETFGYAEPGFADLAGTPFRTVEIQLLSDFDEYPLAP